MIIIIILIIMITIIIIILVIIIIIMIRSRRTTTIIIIIIMIIIMIIIIIMIMIIMIIIIDFFSEIPFIKTGLPFQKIGIACNVMILHIWWPWTRKSVSQNISYLWLWVILGHSLSRTRIQLTDRIFLAEIKAPKRTIISAQYSAGLTLS